ncbi:HVO_0234 family beta-propeller protein [Halovivax limisalsi]|uniref:HVO_0234 family beta-propeller protein n=1 Tax=Halovivax limisalsi TaxID=1453760 RepID=UPI001FFCD8A4|nr:hypothetical protein [Halovivax limisalsi]
MQTLSEKRVYDDRVGARTGYVACETGLVAVRVTGTSVGEFSLVDRRPARDVALTRTGPTVDGARAAGDPTAATTVDGGSADARTAADASESAPESASGSARSLLVVATADDVVVGTPASDRAAAPDGDAGDSPTDPALAATGFGPAVAVGIGPNGIVAASPAGELRRLEYERPGSVTNGDREPGDDPESWESIDTPDDWKTGDAPESATIDAHDNPETAGDSDGERVTAVAPPLVGTDRGVYRLGGDSLRPAGLEAVRTVASADAPLVGTTAGLYALGNGWLRRFDGPVDAVTRVESASSAATGRNGAPTVGASAVLASGRELYAATEGSTTDSESWTPVATAEAPVVDLTSVASGHVWALAADGSILVLDCRDADADSIDARSHPLGIVDPRSVDAPTA